MDAGFPRFSGEERQDLGWEKTRTQHTERMNTAWDSGVESDQNYSRWLVVEMAVAVLCCSGTGFRHIQSGLCSVLATEPRELAYNQGGVASVFEKNIFQWRLSWPTIKIQLSFLSTHTCGLGQEGDTDLLRAGENQWGMKYHCEYVWPCLVLKLPCVGM